MKSQTKALLASVMVLALALSSIGGVTYSWFSDVQTSSLGIETATIDVRSGVNVDSAASGICNDPSDPLALIVQTNAVGTVELWVENHSSIYTDISAKIVVERYQALDSLTGAWVAEVYKDNNGTYRAIAGLENASFWRAWHALSINGDILKEQFVSSSAGQIVEGLDSGKTYIVKRNDYTYSLLENTFAPFIQNEAGEPETPTPAEVPLYIEVGKYYVPDAIHKISITVTAVQSSSTVFNITSGSAEALILNKEKPLCFIGEGFIIKIPKVVLNSDELNKISININSVTECIKLRLSFLKEDSNLAEPGSGSVSIIFNHNGTTGTLIAPASNGEYILYSLNTGGSS